MRRKIQKQATLVPVRKQREVIRDVMLSAGQCATWLTLEELAKLRHYPPASISAQLRHLRKPRYGGYAVVKRCRAVNRAVLAEGFGTLWEYSIEPVRCLFGTKRRSRQDCGRRRGARTKASSRRASKPPVAAGRQQSARDSGTEPRRVWV